jgi:ferredoxin-type protein NapF
MAGMRYLFRTFSLRAFSAFFAVVLAIPLSWKGLTGFYTWLSPFVMLNSVLALKSFVLLNIVAGLVLLIVIFRKKWFCIHLCPVGWGCDKISGLSQRKVIKYKRLPDIGKWLAIISLAASVIGFPLFVILDPLALFNGFFTIFSGHFNLYVLISAAGLPLILIINLFLPGIWCSKLCPLGGFQSVISELRALAGRLSGGKKQEPAKSDTGRRYFVMSGIGLLAGATIPKFLKPRANRIIRPPAAVDQVLFNSLCCRCGNCNKACPTGIIIPHTDFDNILSWMTPEISFKEGYCLETCNLCSQVCPTGAITLFSPKAKSQLFMGTARIHLENCLLLKNKECVRCKESCKYEAIKFDAEGNILNVRPVADITKCVGCGACAVICPVGCIEICPVHPE